MKANGEKRELITSPPDLYHDSYLYFVDWTRFQEKATQNYKGHPKKNHPDSFYIIYLATKEMPEI